MPTKSAPNGWMDHHTKKVASRRVKLGLFILILVVIVLIIGKTAAFIKSLFEPLTPSSSQRNFTWEGQSNLNLVVLGNKISVFSFDPLNLRINIIDIPENLLLDVPPDKGKWQVRSIYGLGQSENPPSGNKLLKSSVSAFLGLPLDGYLEFGGEIKDKDPVKLLESLKSSPQSYFQTLANIRTDLTPIEMIRLSFSLPKVRFDKLKSFDLISSGSLEDVRLKDGTEVFVADPVKVDSISQKLAEESIVSERVSVAIFNATSYPGIGQRAARMVTNMGGNVISVKNSPREVKSSQVWGKDSYTKKRLSKIFILDCNNNPKCDTIGSSEVKDSRADINIILGEDFYLR